MASRYWAVRIGGEPKAQVGSKRDRNVLTEIILGSDRTVYIECNLTNHKIFCGIK